MLNLQIPRYPTFLEGWMDDLQFYILFNSNSVISGQWRDDKRLFAMRPCLQLRQFWLEQGLNQDC